MSSLIMLLVRLHGAFRSQQDHENHQVVLAGVCGSALPLLIDCRTACWRVCAIITSHARLLRDEKHEKEFDL